MSSASIGMRDEDPAYSIRTGRSAPVREHDFAAAHRGDPRADSPLDSSPLSLALDTIRRVAEEAA
jgi:hypothetical protein